MSIFSSADFFAAFQGATRIEPVELPGGNVICVRMLTAHERTQFEVDITDKKNNGFASCRERLVVLCACDSQGKRIFEDSDTTKIGTMDHDLIEPIVEAARKLNKIMTTSEDAKKN